MRGSATGRCVAATRAYRQLCERLESVELSGRDVGERVTALAFEYVAFARGNRALFDLMWRMTQVDCHDPELAEQKDRALRGTDFDGDPVLVQSYAVWSLVRGYTTLALVGAIDAEAADPLASDLPPRCFSSSTSAPEIGGDRTLRGGFRPQLHPHR